MANNNWGNVFWALVVAAISGFSVWYILTNWSPAGQRAAAKYAARALKCAGQESIRGFTDDQVETIQRL
jgi:hypothetical protein